MTQIQVPGVLDRTYTFSSTQNDGRITQMADAVSGETVQYQYDSLKRLISASTTGPQWGQSFGYDSFGNLLNQVVTKGSAPSMSLTVNPANNRINGYSYDNNGNLTSMTNLTLTHDVENRLVQSVHSSNGTERYVYSPSNERVWKQEPSRTLVFFYGIEGNLLATYGDGANNDYNVYFGAKLVWAEASPGIAAGPVTLDRLGSVVRHFPYGQEPTDTGQDRVKFATYYRDQTTVFDYARNRYYSRSIARFTAPDPFGGSASLAAPQSLNRYSYVQGDPVNANDPSGLAMIFGCYDDRCWGGGGLFWDSFGGDYDSFDFVDEFNLNQYGYMQEHTTPAALGGLWEHDQRVQNTNDANAATAALFAGDINTVVNLMNQNPTLNFGGIPAVQTTVTYPDGTQLIGPWTQTTSSPSNSSSPPVGGDVPTTFSVGYNSPYLLGGQVQVTLLPGISGVALSLSATFGTPGLSWNGGPLLWGSPLLGTSSLSPTSAQAADLLRGPGWGFTGGANVGGEAVGNFQGGWLGGPIVGSPTVQVGAGWTWVFRP
jgi:RHS repeat-associated protein